MCECELEFLVMTLLTCYSFFFKLISDDIMQVNPHTHQVKLCDFGSAKVLVCRIVLKEEMFLSKWMLTIKINIFLAG